jgi:hypothetical protein
MENSWRSVTAGVLDIISGVGMLFVCFWLVVAGGITSVVGSVPPWVTGLLFALAIPLALLAILAVIGGIFSIKRRSWGMALTGAIAAFFCCFLFGIVSIILTALSHSEFK